MKRMHMHVTVTDLDRSVAFYSTLFGATPTVRKHDYAKWMVDDPRVNFAISTAPTAGLSHLGVQAETPEELHDLAVRLVGAGETTYDEPNATCCYARSDKAWVTDPSGLRWETFHTFGEATVYGEDRGFAKEPTAPQHAASCCA